METHYFPQLREAYSTKTEWARNLIPKLKKEAESRKKKKSSDKHTHKFWRACFGCSLQKEAFFNHKITQKNRKKRMPKQGKSSKWQKN